MVRLYMHVTLHFLYNIVYSIMDLNEMKYDNKVVSLPKKMMITAYIFGSV